MKNRTVAGLLAAIAVLLALNLIVNGTPEAGAQASMGTGEPYIVKVLPLRASLYLRVWSDGRVDTMQRPTGQNCDYEQVWAQGRVEHPTPVVDAILPSEFGTKAMLTFGDGRIDLVEQEQRCTIAGVGTPSLCTADVDRNGEIGTSDLLELLNQWGPCPEQQGEHQ